MTTRNRRLPRPIAQIAAPVLLFAALLVALLQYPQPAPAQSQPYDLSITVIDVGQGDSILLASGGQYALVDAGENSRGDDVVAYLKGVGVNRLLAVVGTHPHADHIGGVDAVLDALPVDALYMSAREANTETYEDVLDAAARKGLAITIPKPGDTFRLGGAELTFLWPPAGYGSENENDCSLVVLARAGGHSALLCGDIEKSAEKALVNGGASLDCDVLKVAHHGSDTSSTKAFLEAATPEIALISVGAHNDYKHPGKDVLRRLVNVGAKYYRTDLAGNITVYFSGEGITVATEKQGE